MLVIAVYFSMSFQTIKNDKLILIDIGHGGEDSGAIFEEMTEYQINAAIAKKLKRLSIHKDARVEILENANEFMSLQDRLKRIDQWNPDLMISLHVGSSSNADTRFVNAFYSEDFQDQDQLNFMSNELLKSLSKSTSLKGRAAASSKFKILQSKKTPSILLEIGNLNNHEDRKVITSDAGQDKIAQSILEVVSR